MSMHAHVYACVCERVCARTCVQGGGGALESQAERITAWPHISCTAFEVLKSSVRSVGRVWSRALLVCLGAGVYPPRQGRS